MSDRKSRTLLTPPYHVTELVDYDEIQLKFTAPRWPGVYTFAVCLRSDSYLGFDQMHDIKVLVNCFEKFTFQDFNSFRLHYSSMSKKHLKFLQNIRNGIYPTKTMKVKPKTMMEEFLNSLPMKMSKIENIIFMFLEKKSKKSRLFQCKHDLK